MTAQRRPRSGVLCLGTVVALASGVPAQAQDMTGPDLTGTWRMEMAVANTAKVPLLGDTLVISKQLNLATITATGSGWSQHHQACDLRSESSRSLATTRFPPGFVQSLPDKTYDLELTRDGDKWAVAADLLPLHVGYDPHAAPGFPSQADDPGVFDWDRDGKPGATVQIDAVLFGSVELYIVQASHTVLSGLVGTDADGEVTGLSGRLSLEGMVMNSIGATNRLFLTQPEVTFTPDQSGFEMTRVPDGTTCGQLLAEGW